VTRNQQTALFLAIAVLGSYAIGALWVTHPQWGWLSQYLMWTPGIAALVLQAIRREPPRALGFRFTGAAPWLVAFAYPLLLVGGCIAIAYAIRLTTGRDVIHFQPDAIQLKVLGVTASGLALVPLRLLRQAEIMLPWLVLALAYRYALPEKLGRGAHVARAALWGGVFWCYPGPWWLPPGCIGEELGWRGWVVRVWRDRPLAALGILAVAWAAFHVPIVVFEPALHGVVPALAFLLSVAAGAAAFQALYQWSGSVWPPIVAHFTWNFWNPFFLGDQYGPHPSLFGGELWLINGEGLLGMLINAVITVVLVQRWRAVEHLTAADEESRRYEVAADLL
jgi:membrane protease YdiL (CAAX protease family)